MRRTKIVSTLGPATDAPGVLQKMLEAGVNVVRLNYSHGVAADHARRAEQVRSLSQQLGLDIAVLADLQGPKIRIERFAAGPVHLETGQSFTLDTAMDHGAGDATAVACSYTELPQDVGPGDTLLLDDGAISLRVERVDGTRVVTTVQNEGMLSDRKGINRQGGGLSAKALTDKDREDLRHAVEIGADFIAVSFPRSGEDMREARSLLHAAGGHAALVAKIERAEALPNLDDILGATDAVMVARGDLGVEIGDAELPAWQKRIIASALEHNKMVITATQMMESMIEHPVPTRAEVMDVANAVFDGTDAVMLSAETANGKYPVKVIEAMARVCVGAERGRARTRPRQRRQFDVHFERTDEAIALATAWTADRMHARAIIALTESGTTAALVSRTETRVPIYALTPHERTRRRLALCRDVYPLAFNASRMDTLAPVTEAIDFLKARGALHKGDRVLLTKGDMQMSGATNEMKIISVG